MGKALLIFKTCLLLFIAGSVFSQNDEKSTLIGNAGDRETTNNLCADATGNKYIGGQSNQKGLVIKQNSANVILWSKTLNYTSNPAHQVSIGFLDVIGDTVFGCGKITESISQLGVGSFYFKMNAQTGALYWSKSETSGSNFLSCMRYANGKFFLVGGNSSTSSNPTGTVMAVSSQTGQVIWQNTGIQGVVSGQMFRTMFSSATELVNGKLFIIGALYDNVFLLVPRIVLIGINENGTIFLQKQILISGTILGSDEYSGIRIEYDQNQKLVFVLSDDIIQNIMDPILLKCDLQGNLLFAKRYGLPGNSLKFLYQINETASHYVLFGQHLTGWDGLYTVKVFKDGTLDKSIGISKPNVDYILPLGFNFGMGNSTFINGLHYFPTTETALSVFNLDINQIILDEDLNIVGDCSETTELSFVETNVPVTITPLVLQTNPAPLAYSNTVVLENELFNEPCQNLSLDLVQYATCEGIITAVSSGFTDPTFYWSNGTSDTSNTITVSTTDTVFVRVLDTKCCELIDTIVPVLVPSSFVMNLPNDTTVCLQSGTSLTVVPSFSGQSGTVDYLWSDNSTGNSLSVIQSGTYWVDATDDCRTLRDSMVVTVNWFPVIGNATNIPVCEGEFPVTLNPTVSAGATVLWEDGTTTISRVVDTAGTYTISATNVCGTVNATIAVSQINLPTVELIPLIDTCIQNGGTVPLVPVFTNMNTVLWSDGSGGNQLPVSNSGTYTVYVSNSCGTDSATCLVTINHFPELDLPAVLDTCFEIGVGFSYTASGSGGSYQWSSGSQTATEWISQEGIYSVTLTNQCGSVTDTMTVHRMLEPDLYFPEDSIRDCQRQIPVSLLHIETNYNLEILAPYHGTVTTYLTESGWYRVHAFNGCWHKWDSIYVDLQDAFFYLPNSFTPNGDSHNDRLEFKGENMVIRDVHIFNRWGEEVFTGIGSFEGWDGMYRGEICPDGIYAVHLIYEDCFGLPTEFKGHVNLLR